MIGAQSVDLIEDAEGFKRAVFGDHIGRIGPITPGERVGAIAVGQLFRLIATRIGQNGLCQIMHGADVVGDLCRIGPVAGRAQDQAHLAACHFFVGDGQQSVARYHRRGCCARR